MSPRRPNANVSNNFVQLAKPLHMSPELQREVFAAKVEYLAMISDSLPPDDPTTPQPIATAPLDETPVRVFAAGRWHDAQYVEALSMEDNGAYDWRAWQLRWAEINSYGVRPGEPPTHWLPQTPAP